MAKTAVVRARMEPELKASAERVMNDIGLKPSDAINMLYRQVERTGELPFEPTAKTSRETKEDLKRLGRINGGEFVENREVIAWLKSIGTDKELACPAK